jgi:drug/metabolite transporter (DMT)-like permease
MNEPSASETGIEAGANKAWIWYLAGLGAHTGWGAYPVMARYLQTVAELPSMALLLAANLTAMTALVAFVRPPLKRRFLRSRLVWFFLVVIVVRAITNLLAARFTLAIYVQLITLLTPFLVALLSSTLFRDHIPPNTIRAIFLAFLGGLLMMSGDIGEAGVQLALGSEDWLGIGLAFLSTFSLALYMLIIRRSVRQHIPGESMFLLQLISVSAVTLPVSLLTGEEWGRWRDLPPEGWLLFAVFSLAVVMGSNMGQIAALRHLGAPLVSSLLAWRLVSALIIAALLLDERLTTWWQIVGALVVLLTITWYLRGQRAASSAQVRQKAGPGGRCRDRFLRFRL